MADRIIIEDLGPEYNYKRPDQCPGNVPVDAFTIDEIDLQCKPTGVLTPELIQQVVTQYPLDSRGLHGTAHWMRVRRNGLILSNRSGGNRKVVELFALFHDSLRMNEGWDEFHGERGAQQAYKFWKRGAFPASPSEFELLEWACTEHTTGGNEPGDDTVATCWDADRLDLWRVGIRPNPYKLCTPTARNNELIEWCIQSSEQWVRRYYQR